MSARLLAVDLIKAVGIVVVVLIHSLRSFFDAGATAFDAWLGEQLRFAVPGFLAVSGFLYATDAPVPWDVTARRLRRIALPYLVASLAAQLYLMWTGQRLGTGSLWQDLLLCASFGPYYYVFHIALLVIVSPALARVPRRVLLAATLALLGVQLWLDLAPPFVSWFYMQRDPLRWWPYFLVGWCLRLHGPALAAALAQWRAPALGAAALAVCTLGALQGLELGRVGERVAAWLQIWCVLGLLVALASGRSARPGALVYLSEASYAIFLFHLFALYTARRYWPATPGEVDLAAIGVPFAAGLASALALVAAARAALGPRARDWLGA